MSPALKMLLVASAVCLWIDVAPPATAKQKVTSGKSESQQIERGPWGTTYAVNLRLFISSLTQDQWMNVAKTIQPRPPMPWWALHDMNQQDLKAMYAYVKWLGPAGELAPSYLPPDQEPVGPAVWFPVPPKK